MVLQTENVRHFLQFVPTARAGIIVFKQIFKIDSGFLQNLIFPQLHSLFQSLGDSLKVFIYRLPDPSKFDPALIVIFALATFCVLVGSYLCGKHAPPLT